MKRILGVTVFLFLFSVAVSAQSSTGTNASVFSNSIASTSSAAAVVISNTIQITNTVHITNTLVVTNKIDLTNYQTVYLTNRVDGVLSTNYYAYTVQLGAFTSKINTAAYLSRLNFLGYQTFTMEYLYKNRVYTRIRIGKFGTFEEAYLMKKELEKNKIPGTIVRMSTN